MSDEKTEMLSKMRYWLIGTFLILAAAIITVGMVVPGLLGQPLYLLGLFVAGALTVMWYFGYRMYLERR
jgi:hypothetical protein